MLFCLIYLNASSSSTSSSNSKRIFVKWDISEDGSLTLRGPLMLFLCKPSIIRLVCTWWAVVPQHISAQFIKYCPIPPFLYPLIIFWWVGVTFTERVPLCLLLLPPDLLLWLFEVSPGFFFAYNSVFLKSSSSSSLSLMCDTLASSWSLVATGLLYLENLLFVV